MEQTLLEYLDNPAGKGNTAGNPAIIKANLIERYNKIKDKIVVNVYKRNDMNFLYHVIIPSETERENTYDVVIEVFSDTPSITVKKWNFLLFSNSPGFAFTYAYAYNQYDMIIPELKSKLSKKFYNTPPYKRNPHEILMYDKSIFFAIYHITESNLLSLTGYMQTHSDRHLPIFFSTKIRKLDQIMDEIAKENNRLKTEKARLAPKKGIIDKVKDVIKPVSKKSSHKVNSIKPKGKIGNSTNKIKKK
jgi:hypothetical protein